MAGDRTVKYRVNNGNAIGDFAIAKPDIGKVTTDLLFLSVLAESLSLRIEWTKLHSTRLSTHD